MRRQRGLFSVLNVHISVDVRKICSSLTPGSTFSELKKNYCDF